MSVLYLFMAISLDGYVEAPGHDLSWHNIDDEFQEFAIRQTGEAAALIFGRRTYELMADFWPSDEAREADPIVAELMNTKPKVVFSRTLADVRETEHWKNVRLLRAVEPDAISRIRREAGGDVAIFGSNNLCVSFLRQDLLDELRILVNPVVLGAGTPLFAGLPDRLPLSLTGRREFANGNVLLTYRPPGARA